MSPKDVQGSWLNTPCLEQPSPAALQPVPVQPVLGAARQLLLTAPGPAGQLPTPHQTRGSCAQHEHTSAWQQRHTNSSFRHPCTSFDPHLVQTPVVWGCMNQEQSGVWACSTSIGKTKALPLTLKPTHPPVTDIRLSRTDTRAQAQARPRLPPIIPHRAGCLSCHTACLHGACAHHTTQTVQHDAAFS